LVKQFGSLVNETVKPKQSDSALEVFYQNALHKFAFDIDICDIVD